VVNLLTAKRRRVSQTKRDLSIKKEARLSLRRRTLARCARDSAAKLRNDGYFGRSEGGVQLGGAYGPIKPTARSALSAAIAAPWEGRVWF